MAQALTPCPDPPEEREALTRADCSFLLQLQREALLYFLEGQTTNGLLLDRQSNHGPRRPAGVCSTTATGMGFIALALASAPPHRLLTSAEAAGRIRTGLETALGLSHDEGVVAHFLDEAGMPWGVDAFSTVETAWLVAGALWAAAFLRAPELETLAARLYERIDWHYWTAPESHEADSLLRHGKDRQGRFLASRWDRLNGETMFLYVLAAGAAEGRAVGAECAAQLRLCYGSVADLRFNNADLGLFVFQYGLDLLDLHIGPTLLASPGQGPAPIDLRAEARLATLANYRACRERADFFETYRHYWGLSAGDGPGETPDQDAYRAYAPSGPIDGTAHLTATLASAAHAPGLVLENLRQAQHDSRLRARGRYGFSPVNVSRCWVGRDMVGIDAGAAVLALDNYLASGRVRTVFQDLPCVRRGMCRLGWCALPGGNQHKNCA
jgi:hypothetical protein